MSVMLLTFRKLREFPGGLEVKDFALWPLWVEFNPWSGTFSVLQVGPKKKEKKKTKRKGNHTLKTESKHT